MGGGGERKLSPFFASIFPLFSQKRLILRLENTKSFGKRYLIYSIQTDESKEKKHTLNLEQWSHRKFFH